MAQRAKYIEIADLLTQRIERGDYGFAALPGAPRLAAETGVSYLTARQAVHKLIDDGIVQRAANGRLEISARKHRKTRKLKVAYVYPVDVPAYNTWRSAILQASEKCRCVTREIPYSHNADPLLFDALSGDFDLIFVQFITVTPLLLEKIKKIKDRVVSLFYDLTEHGIRCFEGPDQQSIHLLFEHLYELGHRKIDCFFHTELPQMQQRIEVWQQSLEKLGCTGKLQRSLCSAHYTVGMEYAYDNTCKLLKQKKFDATAVFCLTTSGAQGVIRAFYDHGIRVPEDVSVVSFGDRVLARMVIPAITAICPQEPHVTAAEIFEHYMKIKEQPEKLMFRTPGAEFIQFGESTAKIKESSK